MARMRTKIWIHSFQTRLMLRIALYLLFFQFATAFALYSLGRMSAIVQMHSAGSVLGTIPLMAIVAGAFMTAAFLYDALKLTHRLVGPVFRFNQVMQAVAAGEPVSRVRLRPGDMFVDVADTMNLMLDHLANRGAVTLKDSGPPAASAPATKQEAVAAS